MEKENIKIKIPTGVCITCLQNKNQQGITLIALIITVIVILILAGVTISLTIGERGIFRIAKNAKIEHIIGEMREELSLAISDLQLEKKGNAILDDVKQEWADNNKLKEYETIIEEGALLNEKTAIMIKNGITVRFLIDEKLKIIGVEQVTGNEQYLTVITSLAEGITIDNKRIKTAYNKPYNAIVSTEGEYVLETLVVTMGGQPITIDLETGKINIEKVTGDIAITATAKKLDLKITEPIIGISVGATTSVDDNSQTKGTKLYINFNATLEGRKCTIMYKEDNVKVVPFEITQNGKYVFVIRGTYNGKSIEKEKEVLVKKYKSAVGIVKYDAGEWTQEEIEKLKNLKLYDLNATKDSNTTLKLDNEEGLNLTFGGFTYKESQDASLEGIITSRNQSINTKCNGWQIFETKEGQNGRTYVTKIIHVGLPEQFVYGYIYVNTLDDRNAKYILSNGLIMQNYNKTKSGKTLNPRSWDMYKDKNMDKKGMINNVHLFTIDDYYQAGGYNGELGKKIIPIRN